MSEGKIAAQVAHAILGLLYQCMILSKPEKIIVLHVSDKKFNALTQQHTGYLPSKSCYIQVDKGFTEVEMGTKTAAAWIEE